LAALVLSVLVISLDGTIINVALPTLSNELGASNPQLQWIGGGYLLTFAAVMLPIGLLGDRYGHKKLLLTGWGTVIAKPPPLPCPTSTAHSWCDPGAERRFRC
jgi:MFS family permease